jgi:hypothetical protein
MSEYIMFTELPENLKGLHEINTKYLITKKDDEFIWIGHIRVSVKDSDKYIIGEIKKPRDIKR